MDTQIRSLLKRYHEFPYLLTVGNQVLEFLLVSVTWRFSHKISHRAFIHETIRLLNFAVSGLLIISVVFFFKIFRFSERKK